MNTRIALATGILVASVAVASVGVSPAMLPASHPTLAPAPISPREGRIGSPDLYPACINGALPPGTVICDLPNAARVVVATPAVAATAAVAATPVPSTTPAPSAMPAAPTPLPERGGFIGCPTGYSPVITVVIGQGNTVTCRR